MSGQRKLHVPLLVTIAAVFACASGARGGTLLALSGMSSDETDPALLDASIDFSLSGGILSLSVLNLTSQPSTYDIDQVFFNAPVQVESLVLDPSLDGWNLLRGEHAGGFGRFDYSLATAGGNDPFEIGPGELVRFELAMTITAPVSSSDFASEFSLIPPGDRPSVVAIKFVNGPGDDSAFGAAIPEPASLLLLVLGGALALRRVRG